jgi:hypothetical protein
MPPRPFTFRVLARVPVAFRFHPLGNLEFVVELKHRLLLLDESGSHWSGSRGVLGCGFLLAAVFFGACFEAALIGVGLC